MLSLQLRIAHVSSIEYHRAMKEPGVFMFMFGNIFLITLYNRYLKLKFVVVVVVTNTPISFGEAQAFIIEKFKFDTFPIICSYTISA